jgi:glycerol-3-phosphate dehydrogenase
MAEDTVDEVLASWPAFGRRRCVTKNLALLGAPGTTPATTVEHTVDPALLEHLAHRYGTELDAVLALADERPALLEPIVDGLPYIGAEVVYATRAEMALGVEDVLSRRTRALLQDARASARSAEAVAALLGAELGWSSEVAAEQARAFSAGALVELAAAGLPEPHDAPVEGAS